DSLVWGWCREYPTRELCCPGELCADARLATARQAGAGLSPRGSRCCQTRACALAAAVVTSGRSLSLYWKERTLHTKAAPLLGGGAFLGAIAGVNAVHLDGVVDIARGMLGFILLFVSVRFAVAWWRTRPSRSRDEL
ncbi:MAG: sulfite exporter TauE/SafE family protein, partial [Planctomycetota bacterium]|nr:sulfite exporter TauE/SafE family protein [Planctomycetota bacterium]